MSDIYNLLNINHDMLKNFHLLANRVCDHQTEKVINQNVRKLKSIEERMFVGEGLSISEQSINEILYKVIQAAQNEDVKTEDWTMRELRIVSYYMMKLQDDDNVFGYALRLLDKGWKNMYFNGLVFYLINSWCLIKPNLRIDTSKLIIKKLQEYQDNNQRYLLLKNHANLLEEAGPQRMSYLLVGQNKDLREAPSLLGCKPSAFSQSYFSDVIVKYNAKQPLEEDVLEEIFEVHNVKRTKQLVFAYLVIKADESGDTLKQTQLSKFINRTLGDVTLTETWRPFLGATYEDAQKLKYAMRKVNFWFTRRIIETFFEVCVQDIDRKSFWLDYVPYVRGFKIVGSTMTKQLLQNDSRVSNMFQQHFIDTNSKNSQTSALVLSIKNYVLVEFSDTGSLYAYKQDHKKVQFLKRNEKYIPSINDLKDTSMDRLVDNTIWDTEYNDEGNMRHSGYWQSRLKTWMNIKVMTSSNTATSFFDTKDNDIFTAQPLPKQEKILKPQKDREKSTDDLQEPKVQSSKPKTQAAQENLFAKYAFQQSSVKSSEVQTSESNVPNPSVKTWNNAVYEQNIKFKIASKWFFNDLCRVVCNHNGYYVYISKTKMFVKIKDLDGSFPYGSIWVKRPNAQGWSKVIHSMSSYRETTVGYIKIGNCGLIYKLDLNQTSYMEIKTR